MSESSTTSKTLTVSVEGDYERVTFDFGGNFASVRAAEAWCREHGISVGRMERNSPRGLLYGEYDIQKWRNLRKHERSALDGKMVGGKDGPVVIRIKARKNG